MRCEAETKVIKDTANKCAVAGCKRIGNCIQLEYLQKATTLGCSKAITMFILRF